MTEINRLYWIVPAGLNVILYSQTNFPWVELKFVFNLDADVEGAATDCREKVVVPRYLPFLTFQGAGSDVTFITWQDIASDVGSDGRELTAYNSASVMVFARNFVARDVAFRVPTF